jgi:hypothetical protein
MDSGKITTRIACWLSSGWGVAPTAMKAPGLTSARVAFTNAKHGCIRRNVHRCLGLAGLDDQVSAIDSLDGSDDAGGLLDLPQNGRSPDCGGEAENRQEIEYRLAHMDLFRMESLAFEQHRSFFSFVAKISNSGTVYRACAGATSPNGRFCFACFTH